MVFGETVEYTNNHQEDVDGVVSSTQGEFSDLKKKIEAGASNQEVGAAEKLPQSEIDNIVNFHTAFGNHVDLFTVRARADSIGWSTGGAENKKSEANSMASSLKEKGIVTNPDLSTGNTAQAWLRAMTLLNQLPQTLLTTIKDKIHFDVLPVDKTDEQGTYRFAALDVSMSGRNVPDIQKIPQKTPEKDDDIKTPEDDSDKDLEEEENLVFPPQDYKKFESWEVLKKPLGTHMFLEGVEIINRAGKRVQQNFLKRTYYKLENGKIIIKHGPWKTTSQSYAYYKEKKANSVVMDVSDTLGLQYKDDIQKIFKENRVAIALSKSKTFLNLFTKNDSKFALNQLYTNYSEKKEWKEYIMRAQEMNVQQKQHLLASN
ncbi:hypothetical protein P148_SR1C00001G0509 [candidate division SR1 bacterium RAAC1_SR1_1]|nr:hypothetical protein P148_SR1C00001G0509 [candidate division SR1 bacterium RAAC1_SR1_1]